MSCPVCKQCNCVPIDVDCMLKSIGLFDGKRIPTNNDISAIVKQIHINSISIMMGADCAKDFCDAIDTARGSETAQQSWQSIIQEPWRTLVNSKEFLNWYSSEFNYMYYLKTSAGTATSDGYIDVERISNYVTNSTGDYKTSKAPYNKAYAELLKETCANSQNSLLDFMRLNIAIFGTCACIPKCLCGCASIPCSCNTNKNCSEKSNIIISHPFSQKPINRYGA